MFITIKIVSKYLNGHQKSKDAFYADTIFESIENYRLLLKIVITRFIFCNPIFIVLLLRFNKKTRFIICLCKISKNKTVKILVYNKSFIVTDYCSTYIYFCDIYN